MGPRRVAARRLGLSGSTPRSEARLGVSLGLWQDREPLEALAIARLVDALGYQELWVGEMATWDAFALAAAIARETPSVELCVGPLATAVRDPMAMAMGVASVAALGGRPAHLAIGSSSTLVVERWHGRRRERTARHIDETAQALRPLLAGEKSRFAGELVRTDGYRLRLEPPGASLTVAAFGPATVRVAARVADRMVLNLVTPELAARLARTLRDEALAVGREPPRLAAWAVVAVDPAPEARIQLATGVVPTSRRRATRRCSRRPASAHWSRPRARGRTPVTCSSAFPRSCPRAWASWARRPKRAAARANTSPPA